MREPTLRQLQALGFVALISPATRLLPGAAARDAGHAGALSPLLALPLCLLAAFAVSAAMDKSGPGQGLGEVVAARFPRLGRAFLGLYALWLALYAGFAVRSGASRFIYTIYTGASPWTFVAVGLALGLLAALGGAVRLARAAELFRPLLILALLPIVGVGLAQLDWRELLPVPAPGAAALALSALPTAGTLCFALFNLPILESGERIGRRWRRMSAWCARMCVFFAAITAAVLGRFGPELSGALTYPFFALVRNTGLFNVAERIEALITALWVLSDFALTALSLMAAARLARLALGIPARRGAAVTLACAAAALGCALAAAPDSQALRFVSDILVVRANGAMCAAMLLFAALSALKKAE